MRDRGTQRLAARWRADVAASHARAIIAAFAVLVICVALLCYFAASALATADPSEDLIYMPYGLIHSAHPAAEIDECLQQVDSFEIGQIVYAMPKFKNEGALKVPKQNSRMLALWSSRIAAYDEARGRDLDLTVVFNGKAAEGRHKGLNLEDPRTRANIVAAVRNALPIGLGGVQLDLEPYPDTSGFIVLLEELDAVLQHAGFDGRLSVTAPASISRWSPAYLDAVSQLVTQVDPLFYDSESTAVAAYQQWVREGLQYYSANSSPHARIVPVLPSYSADRWHDPAVENIQTSSEALSEALSEGDRVNGAGIWSGWGFLLEEEGGYDGAPDRAAWTSITMELPFSP